MYRLYELKIDLLYKYIYVIHNLGRVCHWKEDLKKISQLAFALAERC